eukprot:1159940-Pelagomonas_calceolata.AAC.18
MHYIPWWGSAVMGKPNGTVVTPGLFGPFCTLLLKSNWCLKVWRILVTRVDPYSLLIGCLPPSRERMALEGVEDPHYLKPTDYGEDESAVELLAKKVCFAVHNQRGSSRDRWDLVSTKKQTQINEQPAQDIHVVMYASSLLSQPSRSPLAIFLAFS